MKISRNAIHYIYLQANRYKYQNETKCLDTAIRHFVKTHHGIENLFLAENDISASFEQLKYSYIKYSFDIYCQQLPKFKNSDDCKKAVCRDRKITLGQLVSFYIQANFE